MYRVRIQLLNFLFVLIVLSSCGRNDQSVVVLYTSQDSVYAIPIIEEFEKESGIDVQVLYDSEAMKTAGLAQRLLSEKKNPRCDVFWSNEELKTRQLESEGLFLSPIERPVYRSRHIVINTNKVDMNNAPSSLFDFTDPEWKNRSVMAYPLYGTTGNQFQWLRTQLGTNKWTQFCHDLKKNGIQVVDGNSHVVKLVGSGQKDIGITDIDDVKVGLVNGLPIASLEDTSSTFKIFNSIAQLKNSPNPENAQRLIEYLKSHEASKRLVESGAAEGISNSENLKSFGMDQDQWLGIISGLNFYQNELTKLFTR